LLNEDVALIAVIDATMTAGILLPAACKLIEPYTLLWLGALLFLNLLRLNLSDLVAVFKTSRQLVVLSIIKLGVLPVGTYAPAYVI
jgi:BASS family bile acid:Na+ symporter